MTSEQHLDAFSATNAWFSRDIDRRDRFARDMSIYRVRPSAVAEPRDEGDLLAVVALASEAAVPLIPRGGGTNTGGSAVGDGIVVRFTANGYWDRVHASGGRRVVCGPAARHDAVQKVLAKEGAILPSDPSSGPISYIGGNVATKASGPHALRHGAIDRYVRSLALISATGSTVDTGRGATAIPARWRSAVDRVTRGLATDPTGEALVRRKGGQKCASGYNLSGVLSAGSASDAVRNLMVGSAGTLGLITEIELEGVPVSDRWASLLLFFVDLREACAAVEILLDTTPEAIEIMDTESLSIVREKNPDLDLPQQSSALLMVEYRGNGATEQARHGATEVQRGGARLATAPLIRQSGDDEDEAQTSRLWEVRKRLFPTLKKFGDSLRAYSVVNDVGVPVDKLAQLAVGVGEVFGRHGLRAPVYGHAGSGNLHLRPLFDRRDPSLGETVSAVAEEVYGLVLDLGGTTTAEHGMGRLRSYFMRREWGDEVFSLMLSLKRDLDPHGILNPDVLNPRGTILTDAVFD